MKNSGIAFLGRLKIIRADTSGGHPLNLTAKQPYITEEHTGRTLYNPRDIWSVRR
jgi:hypothetical protein